MLSAPWAYVSADLLYSSGRYLAFDPVRLQLPSRSALMSKLTRSHSFALQSLYEMPIAQKSTLGCLWAGATNTSSSRTGVTIAGEFSAAMTDCAYWLNS